MKLLAVIRRVFRYVFRSSVTGQYVTEDYAKKHPETTTKERV